MTADAEVEVGSGDAVDHIEYSEFPWTSQEITYDAACVALGLPEDTIDTLSPEDRRYWAGFIETASRFVTETPQGETLVLGIDDLRDLDRRANETNDGIMFLQRLGDLASLERARIEAIGHLVANPHAMYEQVLHTFTHSERAAKELTRLYAKS